jgi:hypothetical protein
MDIMAAQDMVQNILIITHNIKPDKGVILIPIMYYYQMFYCRGNQGGDGTANHFPQSCI